MADRGKPLDDFNQIIRSHQGTVFRMLGKMVRDPQKVEDLAQEVFLRVFRGLAHFRGQAEFTTWLYRIVYNVVADDYRKIRSRPTPLSLDDEETNLAERVADQAEVTPVTIERREMAERVLNALYDMPPSFRAVLTLFYMEEKPYNEIAAILSLPVGTVKTYLHRGRKALREKMLNLSEEEPSLRKRAERTLS